MRNQPRPRAHLGAGAEGRAWPRRHREGRPAPALCTHADRRPGRYPVQLLWAQRVLHPPADSLDHEPLPGTAGREGDRPMGDYSVVLKRHSPATAAPSPISATLAGSGTAVVTSRKSRFGPARSTASVGAGSRAIAPSLSRVVTPPNDARMLMSALPPNWFSVGRTWRFRSKSRVEDGLTAIPAGSIDSSRPVNEPSAPSVMTEGVVWVNDARASRGFDPPCGVAVMARREAS